MNKFDPPRMDRLLGQERDRTQNPEVVLRAIRIQPGEVVADIGAGPGFFTLPAAKSVGATGKVYALDTAPEMLARLRERAAANGVLNVETAVTEEDRLPLPDETVDTALLANVLHETADHVAFLREVRRVLKPGGKLGIVEWRKEDTPHGPPLAERLSYEAVAMALEAAGYSTIEPFVVGPYHYGVLAKLYAG